MKRRLEKLLDEYGTVALVTYLALSVLAIVGFSIAIGIGAAPSTATGVLGVIGAGWLAAKATMPLRILATLAITPLAASLVRRLKRKPADAAPDLPEPAPETTDQANAGK
jgi:hypothetical protein